jgi:hypothetical protein
VTYADLCSLVPIDLARDSDGHEPEAHDVIDLRDWVRPVLDDGRSVLLLEPSREAEMDWVVAPRQTVRLH